MARSAVSVSKTKAKGIEYFQARWYDPITGKRRCKNLGRVDEVSKREANKRANSLESEFESKPSKRSLPPSPTLADWIGKAITIKQTEGKSAGTIEMYDATKRLLVGYFGNKRKLSHIRKSHLDGFRRALQRGELNKYLNSTNRRTMGNSTIRKYLTATKAIFNLAEQEGVTSENPTRRIKLDTAVAKQWTKIEAETFWKIFSAARYEWKPLLALCRLAALRREDALRLRWSNVDMLDGVLSFMTHKTNKEARIPICSEVAEILNEIRQTSMRIDGHVVPTSVYLGNVGRDFEVLCKRADVTPYRDPLHTLRKSCIDDWARAHPPNVVKEWATHSDIKTTMKYYSKVSRRDEIAGQVNMFRTPCAAIG